MDALDRILFKWTPNQIAAMTREEAQMVIDFHRDNPPTMDYMVEYTRSMTELRLAQDRIDELTDPNSEVVDLAIKITGGN